MVRQLSANLKIGNPKWLATYWTDKTVAIAAQAGVAERVWITPIYFPRAMTISRANATISTAGGAGTFIRIGIYADNGGTPDGGALLADSGNIAADGATGVRTFTFTTPLSFARGISAWHALETDDAVIVFNRAASSVNFTEIGAEKMLGAIYALGAFGAFTNPCPATTSNQLARQLAFLRVDNVNE